MYFLPNKIAVREKDLIPSTWLLSFILFNGKLLTEHGADQ